MLTRWWIRFGTVSLVWLAVQPTHAQMQSHASTAFRGAGQGFFEQTGVGWGFQHQNSGGYMFFNNGGPGPLPPFGGFDPNSQAHFGFGGRSGDVSWNLGIYAGQGSSQSMTSQAPSVVLPNGGSGYFFNTMQQPFVTGIVPVVGGQAISPLQERILRLRYEQSLRGPANDKTETKRRAEGAAVAQPRPTQPRKDDPPLILNGP